MASGPTDGGTKAPSPFWTFSLQIYRLPGVAPACLTLQDDCRAPVDVNVLLFALFCARRGRRLSAADARRIIGVVEAWRSGVVVPLRSARRALKEPPAGFDTPEVAALRQRVKAVELEAERLQQECLFATLPTEALGMAAPPAAAAPANIAAYADALGARFDAAAVQTLLDAFSSLKD